MQVKLGESLFDLKGPRHGCHVVAVCSVVRSFSCLYDRYKLLLARWMDRYHKSVAVLKKNMIRVRIKPVMTREHVKWEKNQ